MLGTDVETMGGIASVVNVYRAAGLFERYPVVYLATHCDGGVAAKLRVMAAAWLRYLVLLLRGQVALVHVHTASRASFWRKLPFFAAARLLRIPAVLHLHGAEFHLFYEQECGRWRKRLVRYVFEHAARVVVLSAVWRDWVAGMSPRARVTVVYNPVLLPQPALPWSARVPGETLFLGRVGPRKGCDDLLAAAAELAGRYPQLHVSMGGDGDVAQAGRRAAALGLERRVSLLGWVRGERKQSALAQASLFVLPSYNEGLPMGVLEAMAAGLPILASTVGGIPEAVSDGEEGFLVAPGDVAALVRCWDRLLGDAGLAQRMGEAARRKVARCFSAEAVLPQIERIYDELGAGKR